MSHLSHGSGRGLHLDWLLSSTRRVLSRSQRHHNRYDPNRSREEEVALRRKRKSRIESELFAPFVRVLAGPSAGRRCFSFIFIFIFIFIIIFFFIRVKGSDVYTASLFGGALTADIYGNVMRTLGPSTLTGLGSPLLSIVDCAR